MMEWRQISEETGGMRGSVHSARARGRRERSWLAPGPLERVHSTKGGSRRPAGGPGRRRWSAAAARAHIARRDFVRAGALAIMFDYNCNNCFNFRMCDSRCSCCLVNFNIII